MKRAVLYARVSTLDKNQDPETQLRQLREYATRRDFDVSHELTDYATGRDSDRPGLKSLWEIVRKRETDIVLVWRYDRFARSTHTLVNALNEFHALGVDFISLQEGTDTTTPQGKLVFAIMAGLAEFESSLISERVKAGMERAKAEGKRVNRPPVNPRKIDRMRDLKAQGLSVRAIAKELGFSRSVVSKYTTEQIDLHFDK
jgi:DNA invertase Pin-like site-specific DNA recombinase